MSSLTYYVVVIHVRVTLFLRLQIPNAVWLLTKGIACTAYMNIACGNCLSWVELQCVNAHNVSVVNLT